MGNENENKEATPPAPAAATADDVKGLRDHLAKLEERNTKLEGMLLDPSYIDYIAQNVARRSGGKTAGKPESEKKEINFEDMTKEELIEYMRLEQGEAVDKRVREAVAPVAQTQAELIAQADVARTAEQHKDFWDYRDAMLAITHDRWQKKLPALTAEETYQIAKGRGLKNKAAEKKDAPASEIPGGNLNLRSRKEPGKGFQSKFAEAWKKSFGSATVAE